MVKRTHTHDTRGREAPKGWTISNLKLCWLAEWNSHSHLLPMAKMNSNSSSSSLFRRRCRAAAQTGRSNIPYNIHVFQPFFFGGEAGPVPSNESLGNV